MAKLPNASTALLNTSGTRKETEQHPILEKWDLTVGLEIHAELNTCTKLFSNASTAPVDESEISARTNSQVAAFDTAVPGTQPLFQTAALLPALRAALALECDIEEKSGWDRKHYFHWDQPNGYQITQHYRPFAKNGTLRLTSEDGLPEADLERTGCLKIGIKQIQMEQDTAKTIAHGPENLIDLNRAGHPLIEIVTLPHLHHPRAAAVAVRKIQAILKSVDACTVGMEAGGLRADVNVSVRPRGSRGSATYSGVSGLGQRTEIKNLSSFKAIEDAIVSERDRQIKVLEAGGKIEGETRGWNLGDSDTRRLRSKEGEVDYRYMPDADLASLHIGSDLVEYLRSSIQELPDQTIARLQQEYSLSAKDARTLANLDDGDRLEFMERTVVLVRERLEDQTRQQVGRVVGNWVLMELGGLLASTSTPWQGLQLSPQELADVIVNVQQRQITSRAAKGLLVIIQSLAIEPRPSVDKLIDQENMRLQPLSNDGYVALANEIMDEHAEVVKAIVEKGQKGKIMWIVGQMLRRSREGSVEPQRAKEVVEKLLLL